VEIGGDCQSTDGTEPSPQHDRDGRYDCTTGYEYWLLSEAKKRNPAIKTYVLSWGVPAWIGNQSYFSDDNIRYQVNFVDCLRRGLGFVTDWIGIWNEVGTDGGGDEARYCVGTMPDGCLRVSGSPSPAPSFGAVSMPPIATPHSPPPQRSWGSVDYVVKLRQALDAAGFSGTRIALPDGWDPSDIIAAAQVGSTTGRWWWAVCC
jgi:hypothetical protein